MTDTSDINMVEHPPHYTSHPSGYEAIFFCRRLTFTRANTLKYVWRFRSKQNPVQDLEKAIWYAQQVLVDMELGLDRIPDPTEFIVGPDNLLHPLGHHIDYVAEHFETEAEALIFDKLMREDSPAWFAYTLGALAELRKEEVARASAG